MKKQQKNFGNTIKDLRGSHGMSVSALASQLGVTDITVEGWENGDELPDSDVLLRIAILFGVTQDALLGNGDADENDSSDVASRKRVERHQDLLKLICRSVALAMGIAVTVLSVLDRIEVKSAIAMLGIGLTCLGIASFVKRK